MRRQRIALAAAAMLWGLSLIVYLYVFSYQLGIGNCYLRPGDDSPSGTGYLSVWPFGPGCDFGELSSRRPPGPAWTVVLIALIAGGVVLTFYRDRFDRAQASARE